MLILHEGITMKLTLLSGGAAHGLVTALAPQFKAQMMAMTLDQRRAFAAKARADSKAYTGKTDETIMDVNADAVAQAMRDAGVRRLVHGHTHRPAIHDFSLDGENARRIVLGDWYEQGSVLEVQPGQVRLRGLQLA